MNPEPYRSPLGYNNPLALSNTGRYTRGPITVQVSIPNENPDTEDDLTINVQFTSEGIIVDLLVSDDQGVATFGRTYEELVDLIYQLDPNGA